MSKDEMLFVPGLSKKETRGTGKKKARSELRGGKMENVFWALAIAWIALSGAEVARENGVVVFENKNDVGEVKSAEPSGPYVDVWRSRSPIRAMMAGDGCTPVVYKFGPGFPAGGELVIDRSNGHEERVVFNGMDRRGMEVLCGEVGEVTVFAAFNDVVGEPQELPLDS